MKTEPRSVALITGATGGIGRAVALGLAADGYALALTGRSKSRINALTDEIRTIDNAANPLASTGDLTDPAYAEQLVKETIQQFGRIDLLFNGAGIHRMGSWNMDPAVFAEQMSTNVEGVLNVIRPTIPHMEKQGFGHIISVASRRGKIASIPEGAYSASKYAVVGLNEALHKELAPKNIKATVLCPGWVNTPRIKGTSLNQEEMISTADILEAVRFLTKLSPAACIKEILMEPRNDIS